jgi:hypothetical protein
VLTITDINGNTEGLTGYKSLKRYRNVSGEKLLAFFVMPTQQNAHSFEMVAEESIVEFDGEPYRIKQMTEKPRGGTYVKEVVALHTFFDLIDDHKYELFTGSLTFDEALTFVLGGTDYTWAVLDTFYAESFENFGDENRLAMLQKVLERYGAEFTLNGTFLTFKRRIGNATDFQFRYNYNVKTLARDVNTNNLSTYIKGFGKEGLTSEYTSPNASVFGIRHAKPVRDELYTTLDGLNARLVADLQDTPEVSITIDFADMRRAGYPYDVPNEGDDVFLIYEPIGIDLEARMMDITETFTETSDLPIKTEVTIANLRNSVIDRWANTEKQLRDMIGTDGKVKFGILDAAVQRATQALQSAQTELEFNNGIIARSKDNPNHLVLFNSAGIGVSMDGGITFRTAMTGEGIVADLVTVGTMLFDRSKGGTLSLGGADNGNGRMVVYNDDGDTIADLDATKGGFTNLYVADLESPTVPRYSAKDMKLYVAAQKVSTGAGYLDPSDDNSGISFAEPLATINEALSRIPRYYDGDAIIYLAWGQQFYQDFAMHGFTGKGSILIEGQDKSTTLNGNFTLSNNAIACKVQNMTVNGKAESYAIASVIQCSAANLTNLKLNGNNSERGIDVNQSGYCQIMNTEVFSTAQAILARYGATAWVQNCKGYGSINGLYAYGGYIVGAGTAPGGPSAAGKDYGGQIFQTFTVDTGTYVAPPAPESTKIIDAKSGNNWSSQGFWGNDGIKQGNYGYGRRTGLWFYGADILNAIGSGRTIKAMRVYIRRSTKGGSSGGVRHSLRAHGYQTQPGGAPTVSAEIGAATLKWGQGAWITVNSSYFAGFANGTHRGFGVYVDSDSGSYYSICDVAAQVEITYA